MITVLDYDAGNIKSVEKALNFLGEEVKITRDREEILSADGVILPPTEVAFAEGESAFDVLQRVCRDNGIHLESKFTPVYNSAYIQGIHNIYEFDVGKLSGWMYAVNDWFPNYGCSLYQVQDGDVIRWVYTCDLGADVGGGQAAGDGQQEGAST